MFPNSQQFNTQHPQGHFPSFPRPDVAQTRLYGDVRPSPSPSAASFSTSSIDLTQDVFIGSSIAPPSQYDADVVYVDSQGFRVPPPYTSRTPNRSQEPTTVKRVPDSVEVQSSSTSTFSVNSEPIQTKGKGRRRGANAGDQADGEVKPQSCSWSPADDRIVVDVLLKASREGRGSDNSFKTTVYAEAATQLNQVITKGGYKTAAKVQDRWQVVRVGYVVLRFIGRVLRFG